MGMMMSNNNFDNDVMIINFQYGMTTLQKIKCLNDELFESVINRYCRNNFLNKYTLEFYFNGAIINTSLTVSEIGIIDNSYINVQNAKNTGMGNNIMNNMMMDNMMNNNNMMNNMMKNVMMDNMMKNNNNMMDNMMMDNMMNNNNNMMNNMMKNMMDNMMKNNNNMMDNMMNNNNNMMDNMMKNNNMMDNMMKNNNMMDNMMNNNNNMMDNMMNNNNMMDNMMNNMMNINNNINKNHENYINIIFTYEGHKNLMAFKDTSTVEDALKEFLKKEKISDIISKKKLFLYNDKKLSLDDTRMLKELFSEVAYISVI